MNNRTLLATTMAATVIFTISTAEALELEEIVVTAQKKAQSINDVGMSIIAFTGDSLNELGVRDTTDIAALTPGLTYIQSSFGPPIYTLRGVGYRDISYNAASTVGVYVDEAAIAYPIMTLGAVMDLERTEVLKGPQGTLYGRNNTGGAINYIAKKPTDEFAAGFTTSYGNYQTVDVDAHVNGSLSKSVNARLAVKTTQSGEGWQKNIVNNERLGEEDKTALRLSLSADLSPRTNALLQVGWWNNKSETQAPQTVGPDPSGNPVWATRIEPNRQAFQPSGREENDIASWTPGLSPSNNMQSTSVTLNINHDISDRLKLTSVTNVSRFEDEGGQRDIGGFAIPFADADGFLAHADLFNINGGEPISFANENEFPFLPAFLLTNNAEIDTFSQELRLGGDYGEMNWIVGLYYSQDEVESFVNQYVPFTSNTNGVAGNPLFSFDGGTQFGLSETDSIGFFIHTDWQLQDNLKLTVGLRYSEDTNDYRACLLDSGLGASSAFFAGVVGAGNPEPGTCQTQFFDENGGTGEVGTFTETLEEDSFSGRLGLDWFVNDQLLLFVSYSRGFKAGSFPNLIATNSLQYRSVVQEQVDALEIGYKATLLDGSLQFNGSLFYNDYTDKQLLGTITDPVFGRFRRLINIPEAEIFGAEFDVQWQPVEGLYTSLAVSFLDTEVKGDFIASDINGRDINYNGSKFPDTADVQVTALVNYEWSINQNLYGFIGGDMSYTDDINTTFEPGPVIAGVNPAGLTAVPNSHIIDSYTLINARIGIGSTDDKWRAMVWSRNLGDEFYLTNALTTIDSVNVYTGRPVTYGLSFEYNF